jgi:hypothetical protein
MLKNFTKRPLKQQYHFGIAACVVVFFFGYYILNFVSTREVVPFKDIFGNTFYILIGAVLIALSCCGILILRNKIRKLDNKRKRRRGRKIAYLKDQLKDTKKE